MQKVSALPEHTIWCSNVTLYHILNSKNCVNRLRVNGASVFFTKQKYPDN